MPTTLVLRFEITGWEPEAIAAATSEWVGAATLTKAYSTGLQGSGIAHFVSSGTDETGRAYVAAERIEGRLDDGREGSLVVYHGGLQAPDAPASFGWIIPGSGTGDFAGFSGSATIGHVDEGTALTLHLD